jgi:DNA-directed RNA polymerase specialized sigma24 family protein|tara:strand:- start:228 stop:431 length:204 start_codon:yes stop_codon:yes gene_type:complete
VNWVPQDRELLVALRAHGFSYKHISEALDRGIKTLHVAVSYYDLQTEIQQTRKAILKGIMKCHSSTK